MNLENLPLDIFNKVGSYLPLNSSINLSITNHAINILIDNDLYYDQFKTQTQKLHLTHVKLESIYKHDGTLKWFKNCEQLYIGNIEYINCNSVSDAQECPIHKIVEKIIEYDHDENNKTCNLFWFRFILSILINYLYQVLGVVHLNIYQ